MDINNHPRRVPFGGAITHPQSGFDALR